LKKSTIQRRRRRDLAGGLPLTGWGVALASAGDVSAMSCRMWQYLYFLPLPQ
jgi:hypothetical protein